MTTKWMKRVLLIGAITLAAAACGSTVIDTTDTNRDEAIPVGDELPLADAADDDGAVVSAGCAEGEPICDDTPVLSNEGTDLPPVAVGEPIKGPPPIEPQPEPDPAQPVSSGMPANGGLTYTEETVIMFGTLDSGLLTIDSLVAG